MKPTVLVLSCEHASNTVPLAYQHFFAHSLETLKSPKAYDLGAIDIATHLQKTLACDMVQSSVTRLLIDCDHSEHHSKCFSKFTKKSSPAEKKDLIPGYYLPFYKQLENIIDQYIANNKQVLHVSIHTFAPRSHRRIYHSGVGILYDSHRHGEKEVARLIHGLLLQEAIPYKVRLNYPFSGSKDYVLTHFRKKYEQKDYLGIKIDINQALVIHPSDLTNILQTFDCCFKELLALL